jgi:hypothetical protein
MSENHAWLGAEPVGMYILILVLQAQFRAMRAHDILVTALIRHLLTPLQLCTAVVACL